MMDKAVGFLTILAVGGLLAACETVKSANPLSPSVAGPIPGVVISEPKLLEPQPGQEIDAAVAQPVRLLIENASTSGVRPLRYRVELANDQAFTSTVFVAEAISPGSEGRTVVQLPGVLPSDRTYYWRARAEDGANTGEYTAPRAFTVFTPVVIGVPTLISPVGGATIASTSPSFRIGAPPRSGPAGQLVYQLSVAANPSFAPELGLYQISEQGNETQFNAPLVLDYSQVTYWRVRAFSTGPRSATGPWTPAESFRTAAAPPVPPPPPPPPDPGGCAPPYPGTPLSIVECQRSKYGHMSSSQIVSFLRAVVADLNRTGTGGGPYGLLRKSDGHNCLGYSCDIVCAGQGGGQRQYDVLSDADGAQIPVWSGPLSPFIPRVCEF